MINLLFWIDDYLKNKWQQLRAYEATKSCKSLKTIIALYYLKRIQSKRHLQHFFTDPFLIKEPSSWTNLAESIFLILGVTQRNPKMQWSLNYNTNPKLCQTLCQTNLSTQYAHLTNKRFASWSNDLLSSISLILNLSKGQQRRAEFC